MPQTRLAASAGAKNIFKIPAGFFASRHRDRHRRFVLYRGIARCRKNLGIDIDPVCEENLAENRRGNPGGLCSNAFAIGTLDMLRGTSPVRLRCHEYDQRRIRTPFGKRFKSSQAKRISSSGLACLSKKKTPSSPMPLKKRFSLSNESFEEECGAGFFKKRLS